VIQQGQLLEKAEHMQAQVSGTLKPDCLPSRLLQEQKEFG
jgi:hypothetical protein